MTVELSAEDIRILLDDLSAGLALLGARADLCLVGGAALAAGAATVLEVDIDAIQRTRAAWWRVTVKSSPIGRSGRSSACRAWANA